MKITKKGTSRFVAILLLVTLLFCLSPAAALAAGTGSVTFTFTNSGVTASGSGSGYEIEGTELTISEAGTYTITGSCTEGSVTVKKGTTGVTLILKDLSLSCSDSAPLSCNKDTEVTVTVTGTVKLTDKEDPADESSADAAVAEAFEGAVIKVKSGASLTINGSGSLNLDGSACKNGLKGAEDASIIVDGSVKLTVKAAKHAIACDGSVTVKSGTLELVSGEDGIHSETDVLITGGSLSIQSGDDGIHGENSVTIGTQGAANGPSINISKSGEGIEAAVVTLNSGSGSIVSTDDGINAATDAAVSEIAIVINGGDWTVDAGGDGLDAGGDSTNNRGGSITVNGGTTIVFGSANNGNAALDYDGTCSYNGGVLLAVGMSGMSQTVSTGTCVLFSGVSVTKGSALTVTDASGKTLISTTATKNANCVMLCADSLSQGESYTLSVGGKSVTATAAAGSGQGGMMGMGGFGGFGGQGFGGQEGFEAGPFDAESGATAPMEGRGSRPEGGFAMGPFSGEEGSRPGFGMRGEQSGEAPEDFAGGPFESENGGETLPEGEVDPESAGEEASAEEMEESARQGWGILDFFKKIFNWIFHGRFVADLEKA